MLELEPQSSVGKPTSIRIPPELEPYIEAGMERLKCKRHVYLVAAVKAAALKEKP